MNIQQEIEAAQKRLARKLDADVRAAHQRIKQPTLTEIRQTLEDIPQLVTWIGRARNAVAKALTAFADTYIKTMEEETNE